MNLDILRNHIQRGNGAAARRLGAIHDVLRPRGAGQPLARANRVLRLHASFNAADDTYRKPQGPGQAVWWGVFDSAYTLPGDYMVGPDATYFIAAQQDLLPPQCVRVNCVLTVTRPTGSPSVGALQYGGVQEYTSELLLAQWPASILVAGSSGKSGLPAEAGAALWMVLLPRLPVTLQSADLLHDQAGRAYLIEATEQSFLGWRLRVKSTVA